MISKKSGTPVNPMRPSFDVFSLQLSLKEHSSMGLFYVFQIVQMVPNRANYHIYTLHCINWVVIEHVNNLFHCNWTRPQNHLVRKRTSEFWVFVYELSEFWVFVFVSVRLRTNWFWVRVQLQSLKLQISRLLRARNCLTFRQL